MTPSNLRATKRDIDGRFVEVAWDENDAPVRFRFFTVDANNVATETPFTYDLASRVAVVPGGIKLRVQNVLSWGGQYPGPDFPVPAALPAPAPVVPLTAEQHLEQAIGVQVTAGDQVAIYANPSVVRTVKADGTIA